MTHCVTARMLQSIHIKYNNAIGFCFKYAAKFDISITVALWCRPVTSRGAAPPYEYFRPHYKNLPCIYSIFIMYFSQVLPPRNVVRLPSLAPHSSSETAVVISVNVFRRFGSSTDVSDQ